MLNQSFSQGQLNNLGLQDAEANRIARQTAQTEGYLAGAGSDKDMRRYGYGAKELAYSMPAQKDVRGTQCTVVLINNMKSILMPGTPLTGQRCGTPNYNQTKAETFPVFLGTTPESTPYHTNTPSGEPYTFKMERLDPSPTNGFDVPSHWPPFENTYTLPH